MLEIKRRSLERNPILAKNSYYYFILDGLQRRLKPGSVHAYYLRKDLRS